jgi:hypothetical protein
MYTATNYDSNPNAPLGQWVGIDHGVPYSAAKATIFKPKNKDDKQPANEGRPGTYYGECVSYVKAVSPELLKTQTKDWNRGAKVSPGFHVHPHPAHGTIPLLTHEPTANPPAHASDPSRLLTAIDVVRQGLQYTENASNSAISNATTPVPPARPILKGTVIATFTAAGDYSGHAAIFEQIDKDGIHVVDQWIKAPAEPVHRRVIRFKYGGGLHPTDVNDADNYYVVD